MGLPSHDREVDWGLGGLLAAISCIYPVSRVKAIVEDRDIFAYKADIMQLAVGRFWEYVELAMFPRSYSCPGVMI